MDTEREETTAKADCPTCGRPYAVGETRCRFCEEADTEAVVEKPAIPVAWIIGGMALFVMMWIVVFIAAYAFTETTNH